MLALIRSERLAILEFHPADRAPGEFDWIEHASAEELRACFEEDISAATLYGGR